MYDVSLSEQSPKHTSRHSTEGGQNRLRNVQHWSHTVVFAIYNRNIVHHRSFDIADNNIIENANAITFPIGADPSRRSKTRRIMRTAVAARKTNSKNRSGNIGHFTKLHATVTALLISSYISDPMPDSISAVQCAESAIAITDCAGILIHAESCCRNGVLASISLPRSSVVSSLFSIFDCITPPAEFIL